MKVVRDSEAIPRHIEDIWKRNARNVSQIVNNQELTLMKVEKRFTYALFVGVYLINFLLDY